MQDSKVYIIVNYNAERNIPMGSKPVLDLAKFQELMQISRLHGYIVISGLYTPCNN